MRLPAVAAENVNLGEAAGAIQNDGRPEIDIDDRQRQAENLDQPIGHAADLDLVDVDAVFADRDFELAERDVVEELS